MRVSVTTLLITDDGIPLDVRLAIQDGRREEAGRRLMELFDLSCDEATELIERRPCPPLDS